MPTFVTPEGDLDEDKVNQEFAKAMVAPPADEPTAPAPPRKEAAEDSQKPAEPAEDPKHDKPRRTSSTGSSGGGGRRGRPKKAEPAAPPPAEGQYVQPVTEFLQGLTLTGGLVPIPNGALQTKVRLQAHLVNVHTPGLAQAIDAAARHNAVIRKGVESLTMGASGWVLPALLAVVPFATQSMALWRSPVTAEMAAAAEDVEAQVRDAMMAQSQGAEAAA